MDEEKIKEICQWMIKAAHDLRSARRLFTDKPPLLDTAVYHCQQVTEKVLKAFLTLQEIPSDKIHLLPPLVEQCITYDSDFELLREAAEVLTPFATTFRYPGDVLEPSIADVEEAIEFAEMSLVFVTKKMPEEVKRNIKSTMDDLPNMHKPTKHQDDIENGEILD